jgi:peptidoglycan hydrolase-like protein with peptidoglycan-binding domain
MSESVEQLKAKLRALGLDPDNPSWVRTNAVDTSQLPSLQKQRETFAKMKELLESQVAQDQQQVFALREQLARLKRGGGR